MIVIHARNVQSALPEALHRLRLQGVERDTRNGPVRMFPTPVTTVYEQPCERVLFWPQRDANPFFHLYESLWMLAGRNDVESVANFVQNMRNFSDDGKTFHGAYGHRWRVHFNIDQLHAIMLILKNNKNDRRCVLQMWDARTDLAREGKDFPCNLSAVFQVNHNGQLDMTVYNRSNDIIWGAYGANAVHFSYLQEYVARFVGVPVGRYYQVSANFHAYKDKLEQVEQLADQAAQPYEPVADPYAIGAVEPFPLMQIPVNEWENDLLMFLSRGPVLGLRDPFFRKVASPMVQAHQLFKQRQRGAERFQAALEMTNKIAATDWKLACRQWLERRQKQYQRAQDDGPGHQEN